MAVYVDPSLLGNLGGLAAAKAHEPTRRSDWLKEARVNCDFAGWAHFANNWNETF